MRARTHKCAHNRNHNHVMVVAKTFLQDVRATTKPRAAKLPKQEIDNQAFFFFNQQKFPWHRVTKKVTGQVFPVFSAQKKLVQLCPLCQEYKQAGRWQKTSHLSEMCHRAGTRDFSDTWQVLCMSHDYARNPIYKKKKRTQNEAHLSVQCRNCRCERQFNEMKIWAEAELKWHILCWTPTTLRKQEQFICTTEMNLLDPSTSQQHVWLWHTTKQVFILEKKEPKRWE